MEAIEISPKSGVIMQTISERVVEFGGAALIADYGYDDNQGNLLRDIVNWSGAAWSKVQKRDWIFKLDVCLPDERSF